MSFHILRRASEEKSNARFHMSSHLLLNFKNDLQYYKMKSLLIERKKMRKIVWETASRESKKIRSILFCIVNAFQTQAIMSNKLWRWFGDSKYVWIHRKSFASQLFLGYIMAKLETWTTSENVNFHIENKKRR